MRHRRVSFTNANGERLVGRLELPLAGAPRAHALFAHCFTCNKNLRAIGNISRALTDQGFAVLRFDFTGLGESEGDFADTNFSSNVDDLVAAASHMEREHAAPQVLIGHSLGGAAVLQAASRIESVRAVATIAAPASPTYLRRHLASARQEIEAHGEAEVEIAGRPIRIKRQFLEDLEQHHMDSVIAELDAALLVLHSPVDDVVGIDNAARIFEKARHPKSFISLDTADHLLSRHEDSEYAGTTIGAWARRFVIDETPARPDSDAVTTRTEQGSFLTQVDAHGHVLLADEPESQGGTDRGPSPYDFLGVALGACTGMTLRLYARRKGWPLRSVTVAVRHARIHAEDCASCETADGRVDRLERTLTLRGDLDDGQRQRLLEIAARCPVHRTLQSEVQVETRLAE
ncbi:MAG: alpha/beta fold hydrolase [Candidatus Eiseniibacteriota bacterium]|jgi:putative redox protein